MEKMTMAVPCLFGLEGLVGDELRRMKLEDVRVEDRRVLFTGDTAALAKANICLRTGERVMLVLAQFQAKSFEELFQGVLRAPLEEFIPKDGQCIPCNLRRCNKKMTHILTRFFLQLQIPILPGKLLPVLQGPLLLLLLPLFLLCYR